MVPLGQTSWLREASKLGALVGAVHRQQAGHAFDHDAAHLADGLADQRDALRAALGEAARPAPWRAPIRRRRASCRSRGRRGSARCARAGRCGRRGGGSWSLRATTSQSCWMRCSSSRVRMPSGASSGWRDKLRNALRKLSAEDVRLGCEGLGGCGSMCCSPDGSIGVRGILRVILDGLLEGAEALELPPCSCLRAPRRLPQPSIASACVAP